MYQPQGDSSMQHQPVLEAVRATRRSLFRYPFCLLFPLVLYLQYASAGDPIPIQYDPKHPGYYKPFRCLRVDTDIRGQWGGLKNNCGFEVEAYWYSVKGSANSWTLRADAVYPLFEATDPDVSGCRVNESLDRSLGLCKDHRAVAKAMSEADRLARDLGITPNPPASSVQSVTQQDDPAALARQLQMPGASSTPEDDAAQLARQLGVTTSSGNAGGDDAANLENDLLAWEAQERVRQAEAERLARVEAERQRIAAIEQARREEIRQAREAEERRQEALARAEAEEESGGGLGILGAIAAGVGLGVLANELGVDPTSVIAATNPWGTSSSAPNTWTPSPSPSNDSGGENCRTDTALISRAEAILTNCPEPEGICARARADASCMGQVASV